MKLHIMEKDITALATIRTSAYTTYYASISTLQELIEANEFVKKHNLKLQVIGGGTNIVFAKEQYTDRLFITLKKEFKFFDVMSDSVTIGAAFSLMRAGDRLIKQGYKDFIYMCLIPGTLGGAIRQNAGTTHEGEIRNNIISVNVFDTLDNKVKTLQNEEMEFSYRDSLVQQEAGRYIIVSATFSCGEVERDTERLQQLVASKRKERRDKQPSGYSFGSTFKSLLYEKPAWWYIEQIGLKGRLVGGAEFSEKHANWIINRKQAQAKDIIALLSKAKERVKAQFGVELVEEVELIQ